MCRAIQHNTQNSVLSTTMHFHNNVKGVSDPNTPPHSWGSRKSKEGQLWTQKHVQHSPLFVEQVLLPFKLIQFSNQGY